MSSGLTHLSESEIRARCSETSFDRGRRYYAGDAVQHRLRRDDSIEARVTGSYVYRVVVRERVGGVETFCTCPYDWGGDCKHIVASLLAWLHEPESFRSVPELELALAANSKDELVSILKDICTVYPHLVDEFGLLGDLESYEPKTVVAAIFAALEPPEEIDVDEAVARMENVARQAARLARQGQDDVARRTYYTLTCHCVRFCESYGTHDIFPDNIPYDFAEEYQNLALNQLDDHANIIEREVREMLRGDWAPEILGINDALDEVWGALRL